MSRPPPPALPLPAGPLPVDSAASAVPATVPAAVPPAPLVRVAVVGAAVLVGEVLALALALDPRLAVVAQVTDPTCAVAVCRVSLPDVVVLELTPAQEDPLAVLSALTTERPDCAVLVLATAEDHRIVAPTLERGARGYLTTASSLSEMVDAIVDLADGATVVAPQQLTGVVRSLSRTRPEASSWPEALLGSLTPREREILRRLAAGQATPVIAASLGITRQTARTHIQNLLTKLGVPSRLAAAAFAVRHGVG